MGLRFTVLGCDGSYAGPGGSCSGYLVRSHTTSVWLDAGPGTLGEVQRHVALVDLDAVVVSHEHPDHCLELPVLRNALKYVLDVEEMRVITTAGVRNLIDHISGNAAPTFSWDVVSAGSTTTVGDLSLRFALTDHPVETLAVAIEHAGRTLAYTADTGDRFGLAALDPEGAGFDLALCEATVATEHEGAAPHLSGRQAGVMARAGGARRLVLTHLTPGTEPEARRREAEAAYGGPVTLAAPAHTYEV